MLKVKQYILYFVIIFITDMIIDYFFDSVHILESFGKAIIVVCMYFFIECYHHNKKERENNQ